ncbi:MAG: hypothetical protein D6712_04750 [Chloroflexi bacterium]|nr:MAG: hypothetical protein D6712_04750 [Chloroflexota bacterium]
MLRRIVLIVALMLTAFGALAQDAPPTPQPPQPPNPAQPPPPRQPGQAPQGNPLESHNIHIATSADGLHWEFDTTPIREAASVPTIIYWQDRLWIYFVNGQSGDDFERLTAMWQDDDGNWQEQFIELDFDGRAVDPDAMVLEDGRLRLYVFNFEVFANPRPPEERENEEPLVGYMYSIVSEDGLHFEREDGIRLESNPPTTDPSVVQLDEDTWFMYVSRPQEQTLLIAQSEDGLTFEIVGESANGNIAGTVRLDDGRLRQYICTLDGMKIQESADGLNWELLPEDSYHTPRGCDPSVTRVGDTWYMVYKTISLPNTPPPPPNNNGNGG